MKIANIIYEKELVNHTKVDYVNYIEKAVPYTEIDKSIPTLYVGWNFMKSCNPDHKLIQNADILKKRIIYNQLYFEFSFEESKASHVKGVDTFVDKAPLLYFKPKYTYINLDPVFFRIADVQDVMDILPKEIDCVYQYKNDMIYILKDNKITGINLDMYRFFRFNIVNLRNHIDLRSTFSFLDEEGVEYQKYNKIFPEFTLLKRYMVAIVSK
ncbi:MAG: hypothetical protein ACOCZ5_00420 [bacterium]